MLMEQFGTQYQSDMGILRLIILYNLLLSASISLWSVIWIRRGNIAGIEAGTTLGLLMFVVSMLTFIVFDRVDMFFFDSIRAFFMVVFGVMAYREQKKIGTVA